MMASLFTIPLKPKLVECAEVAYEAANAAIAGGISLVLNQLVKEHPTTAFRVGNVLKIEDAKAAVNAGVKFLMSPAIVKDVMYYIQNGEVLYIPGTMTPTEILSACEAGAKMVKYISAALKKPFPHVSMVASQGIKIDSIKKYISRGASAVLLSDKEAIAQRNYEKIQKLAHSAALLGNKL
ncbi:KHG/KDPG aldolase [Arachis hypogaea]|nr:KHG/KDPG aldolase [Arachis hypogaea]